MDGEIKEKINEKIRERLSRLRRKMREKGIDVYIVPTADFHQSEYVGEHFKAREFLTGFTGSAGTALVSREEARLWVDGRYFLQAKKELLGTGVEMMKLYEPGVPTIEEYLLWLLKEGDRLAFDGRVVSAKEGLSYEELAKKKGAAVSGGEDLIDEIWENRPPLSKEPIFVLEERYAGESVGSKLKRVREVMRERGANLHFLSALDDICWLFNIRGNDVEFSPLVLSYAAIGPEGARLYVDREKVSEEIRGKLSKEGVELFEYGAVYEDIKALGRGKALLLDPQRTNYAIYKSLSGEAGLIEERNPQALMKAVKNKTEISNIRKAQIKDSVAHVRFMRWLKERISKERITEISASEKLDGFRREMEGYLRPSFAPISAYAGHSALCHYSASPDTDAELREGSLFLTDTGAGFYEGSTDITRTYALGEIPRKMKEHFTLVVRSNLHLADARFLKGCTGLNLDILARKPLWERGLDYNHGTGHGVGYLLNIHEGPAGFRWRYLPGDTQPLEEGMVLTDEPGIYIEGSHGVRLENELLVREGERNEYGQFMYLEPLTYVPFDLDAILPEELSGEERGLLNRYHKEVYERLSPYLSKGEREWLRGYTREI